MKKVYFILFAIMGLFSCSQKDSRDVLIEDIEKSYDDNIELSKIVSNNYFNLLEIESLKDEIHTEPYLKKAKFIDSLSNIFFKRTDSLIANKREQDNYEDIIKKYTYLSEKMKESMPLKDKEKLKFCDYKRSTYMLNSSLGVKKMQNEIYVNKSIVFITLYKYSEGTDCSFSFLETNQIINGNSINLNLSSKWIQTFKAKSIEIDNIKFNGRNFNKKPKIKEHVFCTISYDSLEKGNYIIKGRVKLVPEFGEIANIPIEEKFSIK